MTDAILSLIQLLAAGCLALGIFIGVAIGRWYEMRYGKAKIKGDRTFGTVAVVDGRRTLYLSNFGKLPAPKARAFAWRVSKGEPIRYRKLVGKGKLFTRTEWDAIIAGELVDRGMIARGRKNQPLTATPKFIQVCDQMYPDRARTRT